MRSDVKKVIIRNLPLQLTDQDFKSSIGALPAHIYYRFVLPDSTLDNIEVSPVVYITFKTIEDLDDFRKRCQNIIFDDKHGNRSKCSIELAPYQNNINFISTNCKGIGEGFDALKYVSNIDDKDTVPTKGTRLEDRSVYLEFLSQYNERCKTIVQLQDGIDKHQNSNDANNEELPPVDKLANLMREKLFNDGDKPAVSWEQNLQELQESEDNRAKKTTVPTTPLIEYIAEQKRVHNRPMVGRAGVSGSRGRLRNQKYQERKASDEYWLSAGDTFKSDKPAIDKQSTNSSDVSNNKEDKVAKNNSNSLDVEQIKRDYRDTYKGDNEEELHDTKSSKVKFQKNSKVPNQLQSRRDIGPNGGATPSYAADRTKRNNRSAQQQHAYVDYYYDDYDEAGDTYRDGYYYDDASRHPHSSYGRDYYSNYKPRGNRGSRGGYGRGSNRGGFNASRGGSSNNSSRGGAMSNASAPKYSVLRHK